MFSLENWTLAPLPVPRIAVKVGQLHRPPRKRREAALTAIRRVLAAVAVAAVV